MNESTATAHGREAGNGSRILVVDDESSIRIVAQRMLERLGHRVTVTSNPHDAMQAARDASVPFDLALVDVNLAGESGLVLANEIQRVAGTLPVVIMGGDLDETMLGGSVRQLLPKPFSFADLGAVVTTAIPSSPNCESLRADSCLPADGVKKASS